MTVHQATKNQKNIDFNDIIKCIYIIPVRVKNTGLQLTIIFRMDSSADHFLAQSIYDFVCKVGKILIIISHQSKDMYSKFNSTV